jgi:TIR domain
MKKSGPLSYYSCFISYASEDVAFAAKLHSDLSDHGVSCWFAPEDLRIGEETRAAIDRAIAARAKLLLVLSEHSIASDWVQKEVETVFEMERNSPGLLILFPIRLDDAVFNTAEAWASDIRRMRNIGDFRGWTDQCSYESALVRLLRDLRITSA